MEENKKTTKGKTLTNQEVAAFCRQMAIIIESGITPVEGLEIMVHDTISDEGKALLEEISEYCRKGYRFYQAVEEVGVFPEYVERLILLGEESGNTDSVLNSLADYYDREDDISDSIRAAVTYPLIMIGMMIVIIIVLMSKVLPIFREVFDQLGTQMTPFAEKLMNIGSNLSRYALSITAVVTALVVALVVCYSIPSIKKRITRSMAKFPLTKAFYDNVAIGRFASGMYLTFYSGMDTFKGLEMTSELVENEEMEKKIQKVTELLEDQSTFPEALAETQIFSNLYSRMIAVGFSSGNVDSVMIRIAKIYTERTEKQLRKMLSIIEPTLVIILSLIVGIILLSVLLPLMGIMSSIG